LSVVFSEAALEVAFELAGGGSAGLPKYEMGALWPEGSSMTCTAVVALRLEGFKPLPSESALDEISGRSVRGNILGNSTRTTLPAAALGVTRRGLPMLLCEHPEMMLLADVCPSWEAVRTGLPLAAASGSPTLYTCTILPSGDTDCKGHETGNTNNGTCHHTFDLWMSMRLTEDSATGPVKLAPVA
jgi:hypothetical protein